ncbi:MAG: hypothetical protein JZU47_09280 [Prolixibacteraceae bacterium]|nr:hypothetical protein [Prolixibacteraceae bacterium]
MNKGSSQETRKNIALREDYIPIDERSMLDLVKFTLDFSEDINFYGLQNTRIDNWKSFLLNDPAFILAVIATTNIKELQLNPDEQPDSLNSSDQHEIIKSRTLEIIDVVTNWYELLKRSNYNGILSSEIEKLKTYSEKVSLSLASNFQQPEFLREAYDNILGTIVFIREKASKNFESEVLSSSSHSPHIGLLLSFFRLFKNVQNDLNTLTKKHLDYYYLKILQQQKRKLDPGSALIGMQLQRGTEEFVINEGEKCEFIFEGNQKYAFTTSSSTHINKAEISDIITLYKSDNYPFSYEFDDDNFSFNVLYEADIRKDGITTEITDLSDYHNFPATLGEEIRNDSDENKIRLSNVGILVSSPALILENGKQEIDLTFKISPASYKMTMKMFKQLINQEITEEVEKSKSGKNSLDAERIKKRVITRFFNEAFVVFITDQTGWKRIETIRTKINDTETTLTFSIKLNSSLDRLIPLDRKIHVAEFDSEWPCIKLLLNNETQYHPYQMLRNMVIDYVFIKAQVSEVSNLLLANSAGNLDHSIPFMPFGPIPTVGSYLQIQNPLILQNNLYSLEFFINWGGLPQTINGFNDYYKAYPNEIGNNSFKALISQNRNLVRNSGKQEQPEFDLFEMENDYLKNEKTISVMLDDLDFKNRIDLSKKNLGETANSIFIVLTNPVVAFGHQIFTNVYAEAALNNSRFKRRQTQLPNLPYTPVIERLTANYTNTAKEVMLRKQNNNASDIKLIHLYPFGYVQVFPGSVKSQSYLLPQIEHKGNLLIGIKQVSPGDIISIGFELIHAVYIHTAIQVPEIRWQYLSNNEWIPLEGFLLEDTTDGLIKSGIVKIEIPYAIQFDNTRLTSGKFWLRAAYDGKEDLNSRIKNVFTQAVSLISDQFVPVTTKPLRPDQKVEKVSFSELKGIGKITGPFALEINGLYENEESFYNRVSEQLRHKNRAVTNWDVERLILDKFKNIEKVRVYGRNKYPRELVKGSTMQIVLIPKNNIDDGMKRRNNKVDYDTLIEVKKYIAKMVSPYVHIEVSNPVYEQLKVRCRVKFNDYQKRGSLRNRLNNELINYLSPDIENSFIEKGFDESISKNEILNFIESRPYVEFVTQFSVLQLVEVQGKYRIIDTAKVGEIRELQTISPYAILTSAQQHHLEVIHDEISHIPEVSGVGDLSIESDFVISDDNGKYN